MKPLLPLLLLFAYTCNQPVLKHKGGTVDFTLPVTIQPEKIDSIIPWKTDYLQQVFPLFAGQYKIGDTVRFDRFHRTGERSEHEARWEERIFDLDTLSSDGLQLYPDYSTTVIAKQSHTDMEGFTYFPVYVVNQTATVKVFIAKDNYVFAIQEAAASANYYSWYPIEGKGFDVCGNGYFRRRLQPNEFITFLMPKYSGKDTVSCRIRLLVGENVFISKPYKALINKTQFKVSKDYFGAEGIKKGETWMFYGGSAMAEDKQPY
jgi:hypothetical protein